MKILFFALIILLYVAANYWIMQRIYTIFPSSILLKFIFIALWILTSLSFIASSLLGDHLPISVTSFLAKIGSAWLFVVLYLIILFGIQELVLLIGKTGIIPSNLLKIIGTENKISTICILGITVFIFIGGYINYTHKKRIYFTLSNSKSKTLGDNTTRLRIVNLSDMHLGYTIKEDELSDWVQLINAEKPDVVLIAGDIIDSSIRAVNRVEIIDLLKQINSTYGVYACFGNHEYISTKGNIQLALDFFEKSNINLLRDQTVEIGNYYIMGRDDKSNPNRKSIKELTKNLDKNKTLIVLDHQPYNLELAEEAEVDLQLSGHTHKGQLWPISLITEAIYEKDYGFIKKGISSFYISSGMGIWGGKFRIGTNSEYVVIDMVNE